MRDPISRALAGDGYTARNYPDINEHKNASLETWWKFAREPHINNNYALNVLAGSNCCDGNNTDPIHLEHAKALVSRFTYVLDIACLVPGMQAIVDQLGVNITITDRSAGKAKAHHSLSPKERIGFPEVYEYLLEKNKLDIELYEWSKTLSLVDCDALQGN